ncbi:MBL fold metallo-hydrolase [Candidatus Binatia bacterium]|jgi:alkyl sulfatase BDS1-like metallo-beta-lactamase superfamily hydrolase|nr:MBL fold metallo-hydrolase [Candidatus Binatia bacterium]
MSSIGEALTSSRRASTVEPVVDGVAQFHGFCNVGFVYGGGAALVVDTSNALLGHKAAARLRETSDEPLAAIVYTHGHVDHVGGAPAFLASAEQRGGARPAIWGHENVPERLARYLLTWGWNNEVNRRQFQLPPGVDAFPKSFVEPDHTYRDTATIDLAGEPVELIHARAETDDATWVWLPQREVALVGDLSVQSLPNTGNPNKPQRYTLGWAETLEAIARKKPRAVVPGHGDPLEGAYALEVLTETARAMRFLHDAVIDRLNAGMWPDDVVDSGIALPDDLSKKRYLQPIYGCVPFVVRDVLRFYAGWWGGNPAEIIPARRTDVARDVVSTAGRDALFAKAEGLRAAGELRRALHLAVLLTQADPADAGARDLVARVCDGIVEVEPSFIARNFYLVAAAQARAVKS